MISTPHDRRVNNLRSLYHYHRHRTDPISQARASCLQIELQVAKSERADYIKRCKINEIKAKTLQIMEGQ